MIAAEKSGEGKTTVTCALLFLLSERKMAVRAFKCGPDYIDPMFHRKVLGIPSRNLDSFFSSKEELQNILYENAPEKKNEEEPIGVIEGVMGYYDGLGGTSDEASSYSVAKDTGTPVILLVDGSKRSFSALAAIKGYMDFRPDSRIRGIIFNRLSPMLYPGLKEAAERELGIRVIGYIPVLNDFSLESRHLGLVMPEEIPRFRNKVGELADKIRPGIDLDMLLAIANEAEPLTLTKADIPEIRGKNGERPVIAVAMDEAFNFYYQENLDALQAMGAELLYFSPLKDQMVPEQADGLYLGGGYPELFAKELSGNRSMRESIKRLLDEGLPCLAECGGYLYLKEWIASPEGIRYPLCGVLPGGSLDHKKLMRFGYGTVSTLKDGILGPSGNTFPAHEFHHWDGEENGSDLSFQKPAGKRSWLGGYVTESMYAGFPHLYFYGHYPTEFLTKAAERRSKRKDKNNER